MWAKKNKQKTSNTEMEFVLYFFFLMGKSKLFVHYSVHWFSCGNAYGRLNKRVGIKLKPDLDKIIDIVWGSTENDIMSDDHFIQTG